MFLFWGDRGNFAQVPPRRTPEEETSKGKKKLPTNEIVKRILKTCDSMPPVAADRPRPAKSKPSRGDDNLRHTFKKNEGTKTSPGINLPPR